jgi:hypothetical protein
MAEETRLRQAERRVHESEERVTRQRQVVEKVESDGLDPLLALMILSEFEEALAYYRDRLRQLRGEWKVRPPGQ